jgi:signal transduction histidine kinase/ActR/RegA family two-component response regulator/HAMP domain-containing protein
MRNLSIKSKLTLIIMGTSAVALALVAAGFVAYELIAFQRITRQDLSTLAEITGAQSAGALTFEDERAASEILNGMRAKKHIVAACLYDRQNAVLAVYPERKGPWPVPAHPEPDICRFQRDHVVLFKEIRFNNEFIGTIYLKSDLSERKERLQICALFIGILMVASFAVTFILSSRLQRIITGPILRLVRIAKSVSAEKNYSVRAEKHGNDELGQLIDGFNEMLQQIQARDAALQRANDELEQRVRERTQALEGEIAERKRAEAALQNQFAQTSLLNQITQAISERQDLDSILHVVLCQLEDHLSVDFGIICLFDRMAETLNIAALRTKNSLLEPKLDLREGTVLPLDEAGLRSCKHGDVVLMPDTNKVRNRLGETLAAAGFRGAVAVPLLVENKLFGALIVGRLNRDSITVTECDFLRPLSEHVALAAHQAQLHAELEKAYNELRQTQNTVMQHERLKALGQMASGIAHDINNALSPVVGFSDLIGRAEPNLSVNSKKYLQFIRTAGDDVTHIVTRLREFYRHRDEHETLTPVNLNELAKQVVDMTRPRWRDIPQGRGIMVEVRFELEEDLPVFAGIESEVREATTNLILNAVDAIPNGGAIIIRTRTNSHQFANLRERSASEVVLEVCDTGIGMDEETRKHCLEPFFSTKGKRGTGMGLAMVYGVVERHEGKIEIESQLGSGTTMRLVFPIRSVTADGSLANLHQESLHSLHILCIDDEPLLRELLKDLLEADGHTVEVADTGQGGVAKFRAAKADGQPFDLVMTDLGMPYYDGRQVTKTIKRESPDTPVIMLTGWGAFMKEEGDFPAQVDAVLGKPPRPREIRDMLRRVVYNRRITGDEATADHGIPLNEKKG